MAVTVSKSKQNLPLTLLKCADKFTLARQMTPSATLLSSLPPSTCCSSVRSQVLPFARCAEGGVYCPSPAIGEALSETSMRQNEATMVASRFYEARCESRGWQGKETSECLPGCCCKHVYFLWKCGKSRRAVLAIRYAQSIFYLFLNQYSLYALHL